MNIAVHTLTSPLHDAAAVDAVSKLYISEIEKELGFGLNLKGEDFTGYGSHDLDLIYVRTGGTEGLFKEVFPDISGRIVLLTSGKSNSLAASMEILSYLNQHGRSGEIIHGSYQYIADRIKVLAQVEAARKSLNGSRLGVIGKPSDWLISSDADAWAAKDALGLELVDIPMDELVKEIATGGFAQDHERAEEIRKELEENATDAIRKYISGAFDIYYAIKRIIDRHSLSGITLRCFDLLSAIGNTGCLALALLNEEGIPAGCEGDVPALITMAVGKALTGCCGFQANPSRIDPQTGEILLAHCTVPFDMVCRHSFNTHFESGIGIAIHGELPEGQATIFKLSGDLSRAYICDAQILENRYENNLCRTQIVMKVNDIDYFFRNPIGNHHIVFCGNHTAIFKAFCSSLKK